MLESKLATASKSEPRAWLVLAVGENRVHAGNDGYDDNPETHYSWDSTVPNHAKIQRGDRLALWDKHFLVGASVVQEIVSGEGTKPQHRCPECSQSKIKARKTKSPKYKCQGCGYEFSQPLTKSIEVKSYRSLHDAGWVDVSGALTGAELRGLCVKPGSQLSLRPLRWDEFAKAVSGSQLKESLKVLEHVADQIQGGHKTASVRVRIGQTPFRRRLFDQFGAVCAFTGNAPPTTLEAGHLYSYATEGQHHEHGGLLLRRDIHRLFDLGHIATNPENWTVDVSDSLDTYEYARLHGKPMTVVLSDSHKNWLKRHWQQFRP